MTAEQRRLLADMARDGQQAGLHSVDWDSDWRPASTVSPVWRDRALRAEARLAEIGQLCDDAELVESRRVFDVIEAP